MEINQMISQINGYFVDAKTMYWASLWALTLIGAGLLSVGARYFKRILFLVGAIPTYLILHCVCQNFGWSEMTAISAGAVVGIMMVLWTWTYIYTWGFYTAIGLVALLVVPFLDVNALSTLNWCAIGWMFAVIGVAGGCFALIKSRNIYAIVTALTGACFVVIGMNVMIGSYNPNVFVGASSSKLLIVWAIEYIVFSVVGIFIQYKYTLPKDTVKSEDGEIVVSKKSKVKYVLLALTFGPIGVHNMYAGRYKKGLIQMAISATAGFFYFLPLLFTSFWALINIMHASKNLEVTK